MKKAELIYTPENHIPMAAPTVTDDGGILLRFKKANEPIYESVSLEEFLKTVYQAVTHSEAQAAQARQPPNE